MRTRHRGRIIHVLFDISVITKGIDGVLESISGVLLFFISTEQMRNITRILTLHELSEDPHDIIANYLLTSSQHLTDSAKTFSAVYLLWHGVVKVGLVAALLLRKRWAYPSAILAFSIFLAYQLYRYSHTYSSELLVLSAIDVLLIILTWLEYRRLRTSHVFS
jgi:uncharacterized membrane protein